MRKLLVLNAAVLAILLAAAHVFAEDAPLIREIAFVYFDPDTGLETPVDSPSPEWFAGKVQLKPGAPFSQAAAEQDLVQLNTQHKILVREVRPEPLDSGVRVVYVIERRPRAWTVQVTRAPKSPKIRTTALMEQAVRLRREDPVTMAALNADRWAIVDRLRRDGFLFATADAKYDPIQNRPGYVDVTFEVDRGPKVQPVEIEFYGNSTFARGDLLRALEMREDRWYTSRRFSQEKLNAGVDNIRKKYIAEGFEDAKVSARPVMIDAERVRLTLECEQMTEHNYIISNVRLRGAHVVDGSAAGRHLRRLFVGRISSRSEIDSGIDWLKTDYRKTGYETTPEDVVIQTDASKKRITVDMLFGKAREFVTINVKVAAAAGALRVERVSAETTGPFPQEKIASLIALKPLQIFSEEAFLRDVAAVSALYSNAGLALMNVDYDRALGSYRAKMEFMREGTDAYVRIDISEGGRYVVDKVTFDGLKPTLEEHIRDRLALTQGAIFNRKELAQDLEAIRLALQEKGYADARVTHDEARLARPGTRVYDIRYIVETGPLYYINLIRPRGNDRTRPVVITREMAIQPGDRFDIRQIEESTRRLKNTQMFDRVEINPLDSPRRIDTPTEFPPGEQEDEILYKDLEVNVQEASTTRFLIGAGASSAAGIFGDIRYQALNFDLSDSPKNWSDFVSGNAFTGAGQNLSIFLQPGSRASQFGIDFREPWLNDRPVELGVGAGYFTRDWDEYTLNRLGGNVTLGRRFQPTLTGFVGLRAHNVNVTDVDNGAATEIWDDEGSHNILGLSGGFTRNTIDDYLFPTTGRKTTLMGELIGDPFFNAVKLVAEGRWYKTIYEAPDKSRHVISFWGNTGTLVGDPPLFEKFYAGGLGSVRGFATHGISPLSDRRYVDPANPGLGTLPIGDGDPIGGQFLMEGGAEYLFPIIRDTLRGVVFLDAGSVADNSFGIGNAIGDVRVSTGIGIHLYVPQLGRVPIVMYLGVPLKKGSGDETEAFSFSIGVMFP